MQLRPRERNETRPTRRLFLKQAKLQELIGATVPATAAAARTRGIKLHTGSFESRWPCFTKEKQNDKGKLVKANRLARRNTDNLCYTTCIGQTASSWVHLS